jgi:hypothetical protein
MSSGSSLFAILLLNLKHRLYTRRVTLISIFLMHEKRGGGGGHDLFSDGSLQARAGCLGRGRLYASHCKIQLLGNIICTLHWIIAQIMHFACSTSTLMYPYLLSGVQFVICTFTDENGTFAATVYNKCHNTDPCCMWFGLYLGKKMN